MLEKRGIKSLISCHKNSNQYMFCQIQKTFKLWYSYTNSSSRKRYAVGKCITYIFGMQASLTRWNNLSVRTRIYSLCGIAILLSVLFLFSPSRGHIKKAYAQQQCGVTSVGAIPIDALGSDHYEDALALPFPQGQGGLYPGGSNTIPTAHRQLGESIAATIEPLDGSGNPSPSGKIGFISIGVSNTRNIFVGDNESGTSIVYSNSFKSIADADPAKASSVVIVNGAQGSNAVDEWNNPNSNTWTTLNNRLAEPAAGLTPAQVQVAWIKLPDRGQGARNLIFPADQIEYQGKLESVVRIAKEKYPNLRIAYLSSRGYGGYSAKTNSNVDENVPGRNYAYQTAFGVKWIVEDQINATGALNPDQSCVITAGNTNNCAPWVAWGPYFWSDGPSANNAPHAPAGGISWECPDDYIGDGLHPDNNGVAQVAQQLLNQMKSDPTATSWFVASAAGDSISPTVTSFSVSPQSTTGSITATWEVTDDTGVVQVELWRTDDASGAPNATNWAVVPGQVQTFGGGLLINGNFSDTPPDGTWWYGTHAIDAAGNVGIESAPIQVQKNVASNPGLCTTLNLQITTDNQYDLFFNGTQVGSDTAWEGAETYNLTLEGTGNVLAVRGTDFGALAASLLLEGDMCGTKIVSDTSWVHVVPSGPGNEPAGWETQGFNDAGWSSVISYGQYGDTGTIWCGFNGCQVNNFPAGSQAQWIWSADATDGDGDPPDSLVLMRATFDAPPDTAPPPPPPPPPPPNPTPGTSCNPGDILCGADLNCSGDIETTDFTLLMFYWGDPVAVTNWNKEVDFDADGSVDLDELAIILSNWKQSALQDGCDPPPPPLPPPGGESPPRTPGDYPLIGWQTFGGAVDEYYARYDYLVQRDSSNGFVQRLKAINPNMRILWTFDWNACEVDSSMQCASEWELKDSQGNTLKSYGNTHMYNMSEFTPPATGGSYPGLTYIEAIPEIFSDRADLATFDGWGTNGVWGESGGGIYWLYNTKFPDIDIDNNCPANGGSGTLPGCEDHNQFSASQWTTHWQNGIDQFMVELRTRLDAASTAADPKILAINSGTYHPWGWTESNGIIVEKLRGYFNDDFQSSSFWVPFGRDNVEPHFSVADGFPEMTKPGLPSNTKNDFGGMRFGLATSMLNGVYYSFQGEEAGEHYWAHWYDEFDANVGKPTSDALQVESGLWVRFFEQGVVGASTDGLDHTLTDAQLQTFAEYSGPYHRFAGGQDPQFNDGQQFDSVVLPGYRKPGNCANGDSCTLDSECSGSCRAVRRVGDGILLVTTPTTIIADIIVDDVDMGTSPGSVAPTDNGGFGGNWAAHGAASGCPTPANDDYYTIRCSWNPGSFAFSTANGGDTLSSVSYVPTVGVTGEYEVFEWHPSLSAGGESTAVDYIIKHANGEDTVTVNQAQNPGGWNSLGVYTFNAGTAGSIRIDAANSAPGTVMADAIKLEFQSGGATVKTETTVATVSRVSEDKSEPKVAGAKTTSAKDQNPLWLTIIGLLAFGSVVYTRLLRRGNIY